MKGALRTYTLHKEWMHRYEVVSRQRKLAFILRKLGTFPKSIDPIKRTKRDIDAGMKKFHLVLLSKARSQSCGRYPQEFLSVPSFCPINPPKTILKGPSKVLKTFPQNLFGEPSMAFHFRPLRPVLTAITSQELGFSCLTATMAKAKDQIPGSKPKTSRL